MSYGTLLAFICTEKYSSVSPDNFPVRIEKKLFVLVIFSGWQELPLNARFFIESLRQYHVDR